MSEYTNVEVHFREQLSHWHIEVSDWQMQQFRTYLDNLLTWNQVMNLTTITEEQDVYEKHFLDSLAALAIEKIPMKGMRMADIGTGAGFPGLPLAILAPETEVVLVDSLNKRVRFLEDTVAKLEIGNVRVIHARAEDLARQKDFREQFDIVCSRAVANMSTLCEYTLPFVRTGGCLLAYKTAQVREELQAASKAVRILGGGEPVVTEYTLPLTDYGRSMVRISKTGATPKKYPRKAGTPAREPLSQCI